MLSTTNWLILYLGLASAILNPALIFAPLLVGGVVSQLGFSTGAAVSVVSVELFATALASFPALWWVTRVDWHKVAVIALLAVIAGNLASTACDSLQTLLVARAITGLFEGTLLALILAIIAQAKDPERLFGGKLAVQTITSAIGLNVFSFVIAEWSVKSVYALLALASVILFVGVSSLPKSPLREPGREHFSLAEKPNLWGYASLLLLFFFGAGVNVAWTYLERIGTVYGLTINTLGWVLSAAMLVAVISGMLCAWVGMRFGRLPPISVGLLLGVCGAFLLMLGAEGMTYFLVGACFVSIARIVPAPFIFGVVAMLDRNGRLAVLGHISIAAGMAAGPVIAAVFYSKGNITAVLGVGILFTLVAWLLALKLITVIRPAERHVVMDSGNP